VNFVSLGETFIGYSFFIPEGDLVAAD